MAPTVNWIKILARKAPRYANSLKIQHFATFLTHPDQRFLVTCLDFPHTAAHPALANSGLALRHPIQTQCHLKIVVFSSS